VAAFTYVAAMVIVVIIIGSSSIIIISLLSSKFNNLFIVYVTPFSTTAHPCYRHHRLLSHLAHPV
jgi:hypothetical protein